MPHPDCIKPTSPKFVDLEGKRFGRWTVAEYAGKSAANMTLWACVCECGAGRTILAKHLLSGMSRSCGCLQKELAAAKRKAEAEERASNRDPFAKSDDPRFIDLTGQTFGRLFVAGFARMYRGGRSLWNCQCSCGNPHVVRGSHLRSGKIQSCGCLKDELVGIRSRTHGDSQKRLYHTYRGMLSRCYDPKCVGFEDYGGRGIEVCEAWRTSYIAFRTWALANGYRDDLTIERNQVNDGYHPENCGWIPRADQAANKRTTVRAMAFGETKHLSAWARDPRCIVPGYTLRRRIEEGWDAEAALMTPQRVVRLLSAEEIPHIRAMIASGMTLKAIADEIGSSISAIMDIKKGRAWAGY